MMKDTYKFKCLDCGKISDKNTMRHEYGFGYDQYVCGKCGDVMINDLHGKMYCDKVE